MTVAQLAASERNSQREKPRRGCGSSWVGFWSRCHNADPFWRHKSRGEVWAALSTLAATHARQMHTSVSSVGFQFDLETYHWTRVSRWAGRRAMRYGILPL